MMTDEEYNNSKLVLLSQLQKPIIVVNIYKMTKYSKISIGESLNTKDMFILKPNEIIKVKWDLTDNNNPICLVIIINNTEYPVYWKINKILTWIEKNTEEL